MHYIPSNSKSFKISPVKSHFVIPDALCNNSLSNFGISYAICNNSLSHFVIKLLCGTL